MKEEVKRSQNYIEHLERKIKVVLEENKVNNNFDTQSFHLFYLFQFTQILKSLLLENKK